MKTRLPNKPSKLLKLALTDLEAIEKSPDYSINMGTWVSKPASRNNNKTCYVCLAGSVMASTLKIKVKLDEEIFPHELDRNLRDKLTAIDNFRSGSWECALGKLNIYNHWSQYFNEPYDSYERMELEGMSRSKESRKEWLNYMLDAIGILEAEGL